MKLLKLTLAVALGIALQSCAGTPPKEDVFKEILDTSYQVNTTTDSIIKINELGTDEFVDKGQARFYLIAGNNAPYVVKRVVENFDGNDIERFLGVTVSGFSGLDYESSRTFDDAAEPTTSYRVSQDVTLDYEYKKTDSKAQGKSKDLHRYELFEVGEFNYKGHMNEIESSGLGDKIIGDFLYWGAQLWLADEENPKSWSDYVNDVQSRYFVVQKGTLYRIEYQLLDFIGAEMTANVGTFHAINGSFYAESTKTQNTYRAKYTYVPFLPENSNYLARSKQLFESYALDQASLAAQENNREQYDIAVSIVAQFGFDMDNIPKWEALRDLIENGRIPDDGDQEIFVPQTSDIYTDDNALSKDVNFNITDQQIKSAMDNTSDVKRRH